MACLLTCFSQPFVADQESYLVVQHIDGRIEHVNGPVRMFYDRFAHQRISVERFRRYTATDRQCVEIVHHSGEVERRLGPCQVTFDPFVHQRCTVVELARHIASQGQYLIVQHKDGRFEHLRGPRDIVFDPHEHESITAHDMIKLAANEAVVVYRRHEHGADAAGQGVQLTAKLQVTSAGKAQQSLQGPEASTAASAEAASAASAASAVPLLTAETAGQEGAVHVERRIVHGPSLFMLESTEWLHTFSWHGSVKDGKGSKTGYAGDVKVPHALNFQVVRCMPDQMYLSVRDVRTTDDALLRVDLMIFYELQSIEMMLDSTNDMIGDFINAASADVMTFASKLTYETFLQQTTHLSETEQYPILSSRMKQTGNELLKVVYRGYSASSALQEMHDQAISRRTKLRLEADAAREEQEKQAMQLRCKQERSVQEQQLQEAETRHKLHLQKLQREQERALEDENHKRQLRFAQETAEVELAAERARHEELARREAEASELRARQQAAHIAEEQKKYVGLKELGVDLTAFLCAQAEVRPDQHLKIDTGATPHLHLELPKATHGAGNNGRK